MRVLVFGDSITQGYWDTDGGWVERLRKHYDLLQAGDLQGRDEPTIFNLGISADNSKNVLSRIESETIARTRHGKLPIVIIQIGINDSSIDPTPDDESVSQPIDEYEKNLKLIIEKVKPISSKIILVGLSACDETKTTPVFWGDYQYINKAIASYEKKMEHVASEMDIPFIPLFDQFTKELEKGKDYLPDGLHPNNEGHEFIFKYLLIKLDPLLQSN